MPQVMAKHRSDASVSESVRITEIFHSIQGEARSVGMPTVFVRLTGCPLRCQYCDTAYAFQGGKRFSIDEVVGRVAAFEAAHGDDGVRGHVVRVSLDGRGDVIVVPRGGQRFQ